MPWFILFLFVLFASQLSPENGAALVDVPSGLVLGMLVGVLSSWGWVYVAGWNGRVEAQRTSDIERAEDTARKSRRSLPIIGFVWSMAVLLAAAIGIALAAGR